MISNASFSFFTSSMSGAYWNRCTDVETQGIGLKTPMPRSFAWFCIASNIFTFWNGCIALHANWTVIITVAKYGWNTLVTFTVVSYKMLAIWEDFYSIRQQNLKISIKKSIAKAFLFIKIIKHLYSWYCAFSNFQHTILVVSTIDAWFHCNQYLYTVQFCICPVLHLSCSTSVLSCIRPVLHLTCYASESESELPCICPLPATIIFKNIKIIKANNE